MRLRNTIGLIAAAMLPWAGNGAVCGGFIEFTDKQEWEAAVGAFTTIDFTGFPDGTFITDQYADLGVLFVGGNENIFVNDFLFPNDGAGLDDGGFTPIAVSFDTPQAWIAVDFPGLIQFELFSAGELIYTSSEFGVGGVGNFAGLVSTELFDLAVMSDPSGVDVVIDDLHFGVPSPGAIALLALGGLFFTRRRRSGLTAAASTED